MIIRITGAFYGFIEQLYNRHLSYFMHIDDNLFINTPVGIGYFDNRHPAGVFPDL